MEVIVQLSEKLDSPATTEKNTTFWSKEASFQRCSQEPQRAGSQQQVPPFSFGIAMPLYHLLVMETNN